MWFASSSLYNPQHAKLSLLKNSNGFLGYNIHSAKQIVWLLWASCEHQTLEWVTQDIRGAIHEAETKTQECKTLNQTVRLMGEWEGANHIMGGLENSFGAKVTLAWAQDVICILPFAQPVACKTTRIQKLRWLSRSQHPFNQVDCVAFMGILRAPDIRLSDTRH